MSTQIQPFRRLIEEGCICAPRFYCQQPSLEPIGVGYNGICSTIIEPYLRLCSGKKAIVFCATAAHAEATAAAFNAREIPAATILGIHSKPKRDEIVERFYRGELLVLVNVTVLLADFGRPETDAVIMADPTHSRGKYFNQVAAALTPRIADGTPVDTAEQRRAAIEASDKPYGIVIDVAGNVMRHGLADFGNEPAPEQPAEQTLTAEPEPMPMATVPVANLTGPALAYAVAMAEGLGETLDWCFRPSGLFGNIWTDDHGSYRPDEDWELGGQLITKHAIGFVGHDADNWLAISAPEDKEYRGIGPTHLVAACRLIVTAKLGSSVQVPEELTRG